MKNFYALLCCFSLFGCIPIEDSLSPVAEEITLQPQYAYFDSLVLDLSYTDNFGLDSAHFHIHKTNISPEDEQTWALDSALDMNGRRQALQIVLPVPPYYQNGLYTLSVSAFDKSGNETPSDYNFEIIGDTTAPVFETLALALPQINGQYRARPNDAIEISGKVSDNLHLSQIRFELPQVFQTLNASAQKVDITELLSNVNILRAPNQLSNHSLEENFAITLVATDTFANTQKTHLDVLLDLPPQLSIEEANLPLIENEVSVIEGTTYSISNLKVLDNDSIIAVRRILYKDQNTIRDTLTATINATDSINLRDFISLDFTPTSTIGETEKVKIEVSDNLGSFENGSSTTFRLYVTSDALPKMTEEGIYVNHELKALYSTLNNPVRVSIGDPIEVIGKLSDDRGIQHVEVFWNYIHNEPTSIFTLETNSPYLDLKEILSAIYPLRIPTSAVSGDKYVLTINVRDVNQRSDEERTVSNTFYFEVF